GGSTGGRPRSGAGGAASGGGRADGRGRLPPGRGGGGGGPVRGPSAGRLSADAVGVAAAVRSQRSDQESGRDDERAGEAQPDRPPPSGPLRQPGGAAGPRGPRATGQDEQHPQ